MDNEDRENSKKSNKEPRNAKKSHKRSVSQDSRVTKPTPNQTTGHHHHHHHHHSCLKTQALKPRITKLENLEARMASIEVSLSNALEQGGVLMKPSRTIGSRVEQNHCFANETVSEQDISNLAGEVEKLRQRLAEKEAIMSSYRQQSSQVTTQATQQSTEICSRQLSATVASCNQSTTLGQASQVSKEVQMKEERLRQIYSQVENKVVLVKNLKLKLENLEVNDLDSRIHQAELECLLEKEEMNILNLHQEQMGLRMALGHTTTPNGSRITPRGSNSDTTLYSTVSGSVCASLIAVDVPYEVQAPTFYVAAQQNGRGLVVQWTKDNLGLKKGDRLLEVDGQIVVSCTKERFLELMCRSGSTVTEVLKIVVLRNTPATLLRKSNMKEVELLKEEMSSVINKLDTKIKENKELLLCVQRVQRELEQQKEEKQKLNLRALYLEDQMNEITNRLAANSETLECKQELTANDSQADIVPSESSICSSVARIAGSGCIVQNNTAVVKRIGTATVTKSHSISHLDKMLQRPSFESDPHVLQVKIPFLPSEGGVCRVSSISDVRTAHAYVNVPLPRAVDDSRGRLKASPSLQPVTKRSFLAGTDSDSGNYSGDSTDDVQMLTGFVLQRTTQTTTTTASNGIGQPQGNNHLVVKNEHNRINDVEHGYVNLMEGSLRSYPSRSEVNYEKCCINDRIGRSSVRSLPAPTRDTSKESRGTNQMGSWPKIRCQLSSVGLDSQGSDREEWC